jgi:hypothetical protein
VNIIPVYLLLLTLGCVPQFVHVSSLVKLAVSGRQSVFSLFADGAHPLDHVPWQLRHTCIELFIFEVDDLVDCQRTVGRQQLLKINAKGNEGNV